MKLNFLRTLLLFLGLNTMYSCSSDASAATTSSVSTPIVTNYSYNSMEIQTMDLINNYRVSIGLNSLQKINYISIKSEEHDNYMITNNVVNHDDFVARSQDIMSVLGAKTVGENIAYNYSTAQAAFDAWLASPGHKANIEGDFNHFGIAIRINPVNGAKYYTNIFVKI
ncbi:CAP domain-containing protein [Flavobacterium sp. LB3P45]|uniref:CAP domain-containing protein n=1 Tax=Flavobacterium fructosi TaxID=3230416 RepID=A0ABW6HQD5_9FLAO